MRVQKGIMARIQKRTGNRFDTYTKRFGQLNLSKDAVMGTKQDMMEELSAFDIFEKPIKAKTPNAPAKIEDIDNMTAEQLKAYLGTK